MHHNTNIGLALSDVKMLSVKTIIVSKMTSHCTGTEQEKKNQRLG